MSMSVHTPPLTPNSLHLPLKHPPEVKGFRRACGRCSYSCWAVVLLPPPFSWTPMPHIHTTRSRSSVFRSVFVPLHGMTWNGVTWRCSGGDKARARVHACRGGFLADAVRAPSGGPVPGGADRSAHHRASWGPGAGLHLHRYVRACDSPPVVLPGRNGPLGDPHPGPPGREGLLQEVRGGAGEAEALRGQALAPRYARHHRRARTDDDVPQALSGLLKQPIPDLYCKPGGGVGRGAEA